MKNAALIIMALIGTSAMTFAQDGTKQTEPKKETKKKPVVKQGTRSPGKVTKKVN